MTEDWIPRTRAMYDLVAESYARILSDTRYEAPLDLAMVEEFVVQLPADARVLDAGCGAGRMLTYLARVNPSLRLEGVDLSPAMVAQAQARHPEITISVGDLAALEYPDDEFDGVLAWYSIIHTPPHTVSAIMAELRRVLRPGGRVLLGFQAGTGVRTNTRAYGHEVDLHAFLHNVGDIAAAAESVGLTPVATLERSPRPDESLAQGFVLATR